jgi:hypothetical protein
MEVLTMAAATYRATRSETAEAVPAGQDVAGSRADVYAPPGGTQPPIPASELPVVAAIVQALMPVMERLDQRLASIEAWQADQDKRIAPITRLLDDLGMAEDQADQLDADQAAMVPSEGQERARAIAEGNGWLPAQAAPEPAQAPVSLYGGHVVDTTAAWQAAYDAAPAGEDPA